MNKLSTTLVVPHQHPLQNTLDKVVSSTPVGDIGLAAAPSFWTEPMPGAAMVTPNPKNKREAQLKKANRLLSQGKSKRSVARDLGVAESTLRAWLKKQEKARKVLEVVEEVINTLPNR